MLTRHSPLCAAVALLAAVAATAASASGLTDERFGRLLEASAALDDIERNQSCGRDDSGAQERTDLPAAVARALALLSDRRVDPGERAAAAQLLGTSGSAAAGAVPVLVAALSDSNPGIRRAAALAIGRTGVSDDRQLVDDGSDETRSATEAGAYLARALARSLPPLTRALRDSDATVALAAGEAIGWVACAGDGPYPGAYLGRAVPRLRDALVRCAPDLARALSSQRAHVRRAGCAAVFRMATWETATWEEHVDEGGTFAACDVPGLADALAAAVPGLVRALGDTDSRTRERAASAIAGLPWLPESSPRLDRAMAQALSGLCRLLAGRSREAAAAAADALGGGVWDQYDTPAMVQVLLSFLPELTTALGSEEADVAESAARTVNDMMDRVQGKPAWAHRLVPVLPALAEAAGRRWDAGEFTPRYPAWALGDADWLIARPEAARSLAPTVQGLVAAVRRGGRYAGEALGALGCGAAEPSLAKALTASLPELEEALGGRAACRLEAAKAMAGLAMSEAPPALLAALAASAPSLGPALSDAEAEVSDAAYEAALAIGLHAKGGWRSARDVVADPSAGTVLRAAAADWIACSGRPAPSALAVLTTALADEDPLVAATAVRGIRRMVSRYANDDSGWQPVALRPVDARTATIAESGAMGQVNRRPGPGTVDEWLVALRAADTELRRLRARLLWAAVFGGPERRRCEGVPIWLDRSLAVVRWRMDCLTDPPDGQRVAARRHALRVLAAFCAGAAVHLPVLLVLLFGWIRQRRTPVHATAQPGAGG